MSLTTKERGAYTRGRGGAYIRVSLYTGGGGLTYGILRVFQIQ